MRKSSSHNQMQTLRFYTKRVFALVCFVFFGFLILMVTINGPTTTNTKPAKSDESIPPLFSSGKHSNAEEKMVLKKPPLRVHPKLLQIPPRPGEQLPFQPQPPPLLNAPVLEYSALGVERNIDWSIVKRINAHLRKLPPSLNLNKHTECRKNITLADYWMATQNRPVPVQDTWERFYAQIGTCDLYHDDKVIDNLLHDLNRLPIKHVAIMEGGTQVKLIFTFSNDKQAVFKPMRFGRDYETDPNHFYFGDFERHNAEIATFHLDRILGYRRAVPTVGRVVNITSELFENAERKLKKTFFISPVKNQCFVSKCDYYCDTTHAICGAPDLKEGSVQVFLPDDTNVPRKHNRSPYRRTYSKKTQLATWQQDMGYCEYKVKTNKAYAHGRRLLDLIDLHIMDYLIGNQDRHHYETFTVFKDIPSYAIHLDNGRSFGKTNFDDDDILLPLRQCCLIRPTTLMTLLNFYSGPKSLTETLHESLSKDPVYPVLAFKHYPALERRMNKLMEYILECMDKTEAESMVMDEYHNPKVPEPQPGDDPDASDDETEDEPPGPNVVPADGGGHDLTDNLQNKQQPHLTNEQQQIPAPAG